MIEWFVVVQESANDSRSIDALTIAIGEDIDDVEFDRIYCRE